MTPLLSNVALALALVFYGAAGYSFFVEVARKKSAPSPYPAEAAPPSRGPLLLAIGAAGHATYMTLASFVAHVCPVGSVHFMLSVASLLTVGVYLAARRRFRIHALGLLVAPLGIAFLLGTYFLGKPMPEPRMSAVFIALHVMANLLGIALFLLAGGAAALYLVQERRLKQKRPGPNLPPLDTLDTAVHRFLIAGFPLLTLGIITGTLWAQRLELGTPDEVLRIVLGYATWLLFGGVLLLRAAAGWRGRRAAFGAILGLSCAAAVLAVYLLRPAFVLAGATLGG
jgi:ABC-type uncharacterized transport system permease subunit